MKVFLEEGGKAKCSAILILENEEAREIMLALETASKAQPKKKKLRAIVERLGEQLAVF